MKKLLKVKNRRIVAVICCIALVFNANIFSGMSGFARIYAGENDALQNDMVDGDIEAQEEEPFEAEEEVFGCSVDDVDSQEEENIEIEDENIETQEEEPSEAEEDTCGSIEEDDAHITIEIDNNIATDSEIELDDEEIIEELEYEICEDENIATDSEITLDNDLTAESEIEVSEIIDVATKSDIELEIAEEIEIATESYIPFYILNSSAFEEEWDGVNKGYTRRVADQGDSELCMTFGLMSTIEAYMEKNYPSYMREAGFNRGHVDFSENAFGKALEFGQKDPLGNASRGTRTKSGSNYFMNPTFKESIISALTKWWGPINEDLSRFPVSLADASRNSGELPDSIANPDNNLARLTEVEKPYKYNSANDDRQEFIDRVKNDVREYGAVFAAAQTAVACDLPKIEDRCNQIYYDCDYDRQSIVGEYSYKYTNRNGCDYELYVSGAAVSPTGRHAISIIGWDDNFPKEYFEGQFVDVWTNDIKTTRVINSDGAILARNSWSNDNSFYWFPYDFLLDNCELIPMTFEPHNKKEKLYYYDGGTRIVEDNVDYSNDGYIYHDLVNIFKIQSNEEIKAVSYNFPTYDRSSLRIYEVESNSVEALNNLFNSSDNSDKLLYSDDNIVASYFSQITLSTPVKVDKNKYVAVCFDNVNGLTAVYDANENVAGGYIYTTETKNSSYVRKQNSDSTFSQFEKINSGLKGENAKGTHYTPCNLTIKMITEDIPCKVKFEMNGHGTSIADKEVKYGEKLTKPADPTTTGFTFKYWYTDDENTEFSFDTNINEDITLYAKWEENEYTITYNLDGGAFISGYTAPVKYKYTEGITLPELSKVAKVSNRAIGWYDNSAKTGSAITEIPANTTGNKTFYMKWEEIKYKVTFNSNGGSSVSEAYVLEGNKVTKPANPTRTRFAFMSWQKDGVDFDFNTAIMADITLVAKWQVGNIVTFNSDGGSNVASVTVATGSVVAKPSNPSKSGYTFKSWQLNGSDYNFSAPVRQDITLVATWTKNSGSSYYSPSGGGGNSGGGGSGVSIPLTDDQKKQLDLQQSPLQQNEDQRKAAETMVYVNKTDAALTNIKTTNSKWMQNPNTGLFMLAYVNFEGRAVYAHGFTRLFDIKDNNPNTNNKTYFFDDVGDLKLGWIHTPDNKWYYFNEEFNQNIGVMCTGWNQIDGQWYYLNKDGSLLTNGTTPDGYNVSSDGTLK